LLLLASSVPHARKSGGDGRRVVRSEAMAGDVRNFPPVVYVPLTTDGDGVTRVDMRVTKDGRTALFVYSAIDRLEAWFAKTPWVLVTVEGLQTFYDEEPYDLLFLDKRLHVENPLAGEMAEHA
jgi:hypothetical protein